MSEIRARQPAVLNVSLLLRPARTTNVFEETVQRLLQTIRLGIVPPGSRLPAERELATMLGISRDTLREAIAALAQAGYVVSRRGRYGGTFVVDTIPTQPTALGGEALSEKRLITADEIKDTLAIRAVLEVGAARRAASNELATGDRDRLWRSYEECRCADVASYRLADSHLHLLIGELVGSPALIPLMVDIRTRINELLDRIPLLPLNIEHSNDQHELIVSAILHGQPDVAAEAMAEHVIGSESLLRGFLG